MNNPSVQIFINDFQREFHQVHSDVDTLKNGVLEWANELLETIEKECKESFSFQLPKTPREKKARNKKGRNQLVSKCSVADTTVDSEVSNLNDTISTRTRAGKRATTAKMSQLNITKDMNNETRTLGTDVEMQTMSDTTFVLSKSTSTRTKPVLKNKENSVAESSTQLPSPTRHITRSKVPSVLLSPPKQQILKKPTRTLSRNLSTAEINRKLSTLGVSPISTLSVGLDSDDAAPDKEKENSSERPSRKRSSGTFDENFPERATRRKVSRTLSGSPTGRSTTLLVPRTPSQSPIPPRATNVKIPRTSSRSPAVRNSKNKSSSAVNRTVTIKKELSPTAASTFIVTHEEIDGTEGGDEKTPRVKNGRITRGSSTSTPLLSSEKTPMPEESEFLCDETIPLVSENESPPVEDSPVSKKKKKSKKEKEMENEDKSKENIEESGRVTRTKSKAMKQVMEQKEANEDEEEDKAKENMEETVRITRTKSKAIKQMMEENETKQADFAFAKKLLNRAKATSLKKNQLVALLENNQSTPKNGVQVPVGNFTSKSKYHLLMSSANKMKTPLATLSNSAYKIQKPSGDKERRPAKVAKRDSSVENAPRTAQKPLSKEALEKLKLKKEKEEGAALKRQNVMKNKQEELRRKNELKHQQAMKQREKLEQEKYNNMIQLEKEKEEKLKMILQERQIKLKEEALKKKMMTQQKIADTMERRRIEEEARIAKLKEMEAEEQRLALEKQKEQERQEKRAQERLAQKKAREEYELQLKQEMEAERLKAEKMSTAKKYLHSANKMQSATKQKFGCFGERRGEWDYKPRNVNDYGLEDEHSEFDSEDEKEYEKTRPPIPWGEKVMNGRSSLLKILTLEMMSEYMPCYQKSPDVHKMFKMTPSKRIKRTSSAIWNTPNS